MHSALRPSFRRFTGFSLALAMILASGAAAGIALGPSSPAGAATRGPSSSLAASFGIIGDLVGVAATSASNTWAVGSYSVYQGDAPVGKTLVMHWNGRAWTQVPSPSPSGMASAGIAWHARCLLSGRS